MTFLDHIGPDDGRREQAWGATARRHPTVVTTPKNAARYPKDPVIKVKNPSTRSAAGKGQMEAEQKPKRAQPKLASSTARPREIPRPKAPVAGAWKAKSSPSVAPVTEASTFRVLYLRGDIPVCISHGAKRRVHWKCPIAELDYHHYLPLFMDGLRETTEPYTFLALQGITDLLDHGSEKVLPVVPQLIQPLKRALDTKNRYTIARAMQVIQNLVKCAPYIGEALVPYYRALLPVFNLVLVLEPRRSLGDSIDYGQQKRENLIDLVNETLELLEAKGGPTAFLNIKYCIPEYESAESY